MPEWLVCRSTVLALLVSGCGLDPSPQIPITHSLDSIEVMPAGPSLYRIRDAFPDGSGGLWILSATEPFLHRLHADGAVESFGREGGGPAEFRVPWALAGVDPTGRPLIWDVARRSILTVGPTESGYDVVEAQAVEVSPPTVLRQFAEESYGTPLRLLQAGRRFVIQQPVTPVVNTASLRTLLLLETGLKAQRLDTLFRSEPPAHGSSTVEFLLPIPLWAACSDGTLVIYDPNDFSLTWLAEDGASHKRELLLPSPKITPDDIRRHIRYRITVELRGRETPPEELIQQRVEQYVTRGRPMFSVDAPPAVRLLCGPGETAWLQSFSTVDHPIGYGRTWYAVSPESEPVGVRFPPSFHPLTFLDGAAIGYRIASLDVHHPARVQFPTDVLEPVGWRGLQHETVPRGGADLGYRPP
jgi:hypothetical protein